MPKLSIIIPVYNAEKYLARCIDSILAQPFKDWELLLVDDGSQDNSRAVCEKYVQQDNRICLLTKRNGGVSSARNMGLDNAQGEYITFVDADDWLEEGVMTDSLLQGGFDLVKIPRNRGSRYRSYGTDVMITNVRKARSFMAENYNHECWGKFYRRTVIGGLRFREGLRVGEDVLFVANVFERIRSLYVVAGTKGYHYDENEGSAMVRLSESTDYNSLQTELLQLAKANNNPIAWHFLGTHLYINVQTGTMKNLMKQISIWNILSSPLPFSKKKEFLGFKFHS